MMKKLFTLVLMTIVAGSIMADDLTTTITNATTGLNNGAIDLTLNGGVSPYLFQWTGPNGYTSFGEDISDLEPGEYCVTVSDFYCGIASVCVLVEEDITSGIATHSFSSLDVFPNPFSKEFNVSFNSAMPDEYLFLLHDLTGKLVWAESRTLATGNHSCHFTLNPDIAASRYEMTVQNKNEGILSRSVVSIR